MADPDKLKIEVAYARPDEQVILPLEVEAETTVRDAIERSGILERFPEIDLGGKNKVGVFGKLTKLDNGLRAGDRIEIYRPLKADPKEVRRKRAKEGNGAKKSEST